MSVGLRAVIRSGYHDADARQPRALRITCGGRQAAGDPVQRTALAEDEPDGCGRLEPRLPRGLALDAPGAMLRGGQLAEVALLAAAGLLALAVVSHPLLPSPRP